MLGRCRFMRRAVNFVTRSGGEGKLLAGCILVATAVQ